MRPLTERSALELARAIRQRELSAAEVVDAHIQRHLQVAARVNAIAADRFEQARREAADADALVRRGDGEIPPLLGIPFTVKESIALAGMPQSAGLVARSAYRSSATAPAVERLVQAGAIPIGVTNTSELTLWIESSNHVYGRTNNPYDVTRAAGGSSGGEGAAVGCGGSPFGVGSDIGGSIRIPALFCGVFGHKPSPGVVPNSGMFPPTPGDAGVMLQTGPLVRRAEDLMPLLQVMSGPDAADPQSREVTLGDPSEVSFEGLSVTTVEESSMRAFSRDLRDARERAVGALVAAGATVRRVTMPSWRRALLPFLVTLQSGAEQTTRDLLEASGQPALSVRKMFARGGPHTVPTRLTLAAERLPPAEGRQLERLLRAGRELAEELREAIGDGVLLHPAYRGVAPRHGRTVGRSWLLTSAAVFNLAGVPVTEVPLGLTDGGLPVGVQIAAPRDRDHVSIAVALELERVFGGWVTPPG